MFWDMAVVLKATQEAPTGSTIGSYSLPGTLAKNEILDTHGIMTSLGKFLPPDSESDLWSFSISI